jgi:hypothetical protein
MALKLSHLLWSPHTPVRIFDPFNFRILALRFLKTISPSSRALAQAVSHPPVIAEARVRSQANPRETCSGQSGIGAAFFAGHCGFPVSTIPWTTQNHSFVYNLSYKSRNLQRPYCFLKQSVTGKVSQTLPFLPRILSTNPPYSITRLSRRYIKLATDSIFKQYTSNT